MKSIFILVLFSFSILASAQDFKLAGVSYNYYPKVKGAGDGQELEYQEMNAFVNIPILLKNKKDIFLNNLSYNLVTPRLYVPKELGKTRFTENYHTISYNLSWIHMFNPNWLLIVSANPGINSDLKERLSNSDFVFQSFGLVRYTFDKHFNAGLGISYTTVFGKSMLVPLLQAEYINDRWTASAVLPVSAEVYYSSENRKWRYGLSAAVGGNNYNLGKLTSNAGDVVDNVRYSRINVGPVIEFKGIKNLTIFAGGGLTTARVMKFELEDGEIAKYNSNTGLFMRAGLYYSIKQ